MLKKLVFAALATGLIAGTALPVGFSSAEAATMTCRQAAKAKFPGDLKARRAFFKQCKAAWKASQKA